MQKKSFPLKTLLCMAIENFQVGGCELQLLSLCKALQKHNVELIVIYTKMLKIQNPIAPLNMKKPPQLDGIRYFYIPKMVQCFGMVPLYLKVLFRCTLRRYPDIFHCHSVSAFVEQTLKFAQRKKIPTIVKIAIEKDVFRKKKKSQESRSFLLLLRHLFSKTPFLIKRAKLTNYLFGKNRFHLYTHVDRFISINPNIYKELLNFPIAKENIVSIPNGVDTNRFKPLPEEEKESLITKLQLPPKQKFIVMVGRFAKQKRFEDLIISWHKLAPLYPNYSLLLIGDGPTKDKCMQLVCELKLQERVIFTGVQTKVEDYLKIAAIFAFTSTREGLPNALLEAMSSGLPIVASTIGGTQEIVEPYKTGLLFKPRDISGLTTYLQYLLDHPEEGKKWGSTAREKILAQYAYDKVAPQLIALYNHLVLDRA